MVPRVRSSVAADGAATWLARRSRGVLLLLAGGALALVGFQLIRLGGTDPDSLLAYVGGALLLLGQLAAAVGLADLAWRVLRPRV